MKCLFKIFAASALFFCLSINARELDTKKVRQGDLKELGKAFEQLTKLDGHKAEEMDVIIGKSIRTNPNNFLTVYKKNKASIRRLDALVGSLGPEYVDNFSMQAKEIRDRIKALERVKAKELESVARECIEQLKKQLKIVGP